MSKLPSRAAQRSRNRVLADPGTPGTLRARYRVCASAEPRAICVFCFLNRGCDVFGNDDRWTRWTRCWRRRARNSSRRARPTRNGVTVAISMTLPATDKPVCHGGGHNAELESAAMWPIPYNQNLLVSAACGLTAGLAPAAPPPPPVLHPASEVSTSSSGTRAGFLSW